MTSALQDDLAQSYTFGASPLAATSRTAALRTYLFGQPIAHSLSPLVHNTIYADLSLPWRYSLVESTDTASFLARQLHAPDCVGAAVTMPHKVSFMARVDAVTPEAAMVGAINTVFVRVDAAGARRYVGTNTDTVGIRESFLQNVPGVLAQCRGRPALVQGGGGACRSAVYALHRFLGASKVYLVNRLAEEVEAVVREFRGRGFEGELVHVRSVEEARALDTPVLVVSTVPDFPPREPGEVVAREIVTEFLGRTQKGHVLEMCYHPQPITEFYTLAKAMGWNVLLGTEAMVHQGVAQDVLWTERPLGEMPVEHVARVVEEALKKH